MFYLLKNLLLLILVIFKLKYNNLILKEIMVLNASYVCLHAFLLHQELPDLDPARRTPHFLGGSVSSHGAAFSMRAMPLPSATRDDLRSEPEEDEDEWVKASQEGRSEQRGG
jgi:hypothetical protein